MDKQKTIKILMADDDEDDRLMTKEALDETPLGSSLSFVEDGEELLDYLFNRNDYSDPEKAPRPNLILLDLNMPKKDGREALKEIKSSPELKDIPVVVLTTSKAEEDIYKTYELGVNSFISKPVTFEGMVETMKALSLYWFNIVSLPTGEQ
jgi:CheY-like chemotaxis protein